MATVFEIQGIYKAEAVHLFSIHHCRVQDWGELLPEGKWSGCKITCFDNTAVRAVFQFLQATNRKDGIDYTETHT